MLTDNFYRELEELKNAVISGNEPAIKELARLCGLAIPPLYVAQKEYFDVVKRVASQSEVWPSFASTSNRLRKEMAESVKQLELGSNSNLSFKFRTSISSQAEVTTYARHLHIMIIALRDSGRKFFPSGDEESLGGLILMGYPLDQLEPLFESFGSLIGCQFEFTWETIEPHLLACASLPTPTSKSQEKWWMTAEAIITSFTGPNIQDNSVLKSLGQHRETYSGNREGKLSGVESNIRNGIVNRIKNAFLNQLNVTEPDISDDQPVQVSPLHTLS